MVMNDLGAREGFRVMERGLEDKGCNQNCVTETETKLMK